MHPYIINEVASVCRRFNICENPRQILALGLLLKGTVAKYILASIFFSWIYLYGAQSSRLEGFRIFFRFCDIIRVF
jgi:hypothetical protein